MARRKNAKIKAKLGLAQGSEGEWVSTKVERHLLQIVYKYYPQCNKLNRVVDFHYLLESEAGDVLHFVTQSIVSTGFPSHKQS